MSDEVERKFLVRDVPGEVGAGVPLRQGYLAIGADVEVRVRDGGDERTLTVKGGRGLRRAEVELVLSASEFEELWALTAGRRIEKTRHRIALDDAVAELDVFGGALSGLRLVEVEFASVSAAEDFRPPAWFGTEVTGDERWSNASLATEGRPD